MISLRLKTVQALAGVILFVCIAGVGLSDECPNRIAKTGQCYLYPKNRNCADQNEANCNGQDILLFQSQILSTDAPGSNKKPMFLWLTSCTIDLDTGEVICIKSLSTLPCAFTSWCKWDPETMLCKSGDTTDLRVPMLVTVDC
jgi:hypothetical protein